MGAVFYFASVLRHSLALSSHSKSKLFTGPKLGAAGSGIVLQLLPAGRHRLTGEELHLRLFTADTNRKLRRAGAALCRILHSIFHNSVFQRVEGNHSQVAPGGQLIDRTGQLLELPFPAGKALDRLSQEAGAVEGYRVKCPEMEFSLSGVENQVQQYLARTGCREETAAFALASVCRAVEAATGHARQRYPGLPVVFSGGVASNSMLRAYMKPYDPVFCPPQYATDNAMGVAVLTWRSLEESNGTADL